MSRGRSMEPIFAWIIKNRKAVLIFYIAAMVLAAVAAGSVKTNSDLTAYLPPDAKSTVDLRIMEENFDEEVPNLKVMVSGITFAEGKELCGRLAEVDGVTNVSWISDLDVTNTPPEFLPASLTEKYYKDGNAVFTLTVDTDRTAAMRFTRAQEPAPARGNTGGRFSVLTGARYLCYNWCG